MEINRLHYLSIVDISIYIKQWIEKTSLGHITLALVSRSSFAEIRMKVQANHVDSS